MDLTLTNEEQAFRDEVRAFLAEHLTERLREGARGTPSVFAEPDITTEWQRALADKGWLTYHWPEEHGGTGWSPVKRYIFEKECALADAPTLPVLGLKLLGPVVCAFGTDEQKARILPRIISGEDYWCQGFSEPGAGSDLASLKTRAERRGDEYVVNGQKIWTTHAHHASHIFCLVRTDPTVKPQQGISFLLLDLRQPGIKVRPIIGIAGDHEVNEVFFDDAVASADDLIGEEGQGWTIAKFLLENERGGSCFGPKLIADIERLRAWAGDTADGASDVLLDDPALSTALARLELEAKGLEATELRILADLGKGRPAGPNTSIIKMLASSLRQKVDAAALSIAGYQGLQLETARPLYGNARPEPLDSPAQQVAAPTYLNARAWTIFGGTNEVQRSIVAKTVLGL